MLTPHWVVSLYYFLKYRAIVSLNAEVELCENLTLGKKTTISSFTKIKASEGPVSIGTRTDIGVGCFIGGYKHGIHIGNDCLISPNVSIVGVNYQYEEVERTFREQGLVSNGPIMIGNNVWIGTGAVILDNAHIEDGVIISPNSVVSGHIPRNSIMQGNPAKIIFTRR